MNPTVPKDLWAPAGESDSLCLGPVFNALKASWERDKNVIDRAEWWVDLLGWSTPLSKVSHVQVRRALKSQEQWSGSTKNRYCSALSTVYKYAITELEYEGANPARQMVRWPEGERRTRALNMDEIKALLASCLRSEYPKLRLLVLMALTTGMRRSSLLGLRWSDVDFINRRAAVDRTKNGTPFVAVLTKELTDEMARWYRDGMQNDLVFEGSMPDRPICFDKSFRTACRRAGLGEDVVFHTLRHTFATIAAAKGATTIQLMELLNHKTPAMAARYTHLSVKDREKLVPEFFGGIGSSPSRVGVASTQE